MTDEPLFKPPPGHVPAPSTPPGSPAPRRRVVCSVCRQQLAPAEYPQKGLPGLCDKCATLHSVR